MYLSRFFSKRICLILICGFLIIRGLNAQFSKESGRFPMIHYTPLDYHTASPQNWTTTQDNRGVMYFGNNDGVLEFDGIQWRKYEVSNHTPVKALKSDSNGRVYVGASGEFGYLKPDSRGKLEYISLVGEIPDGVKDFKDVWKILCVKEGVYFHSLKYLFFWDGKKMKFWKSDTRFHSVFNIKNRIIARVEGLGLYIMKEDSFVLINGTETFKKEPVFAILPYIGNSFLVVSRGKGFFKCTFDFKSSNIEMEPFPENMKGKISEYIMYNGVKIGQNTYSIGTWGKGLIIFQEEKVIAIINKSSGLESDIISAQFLDKDHNLWLCHNTGITKIEITSPLTKFIDKSGITGTIESVTRFNNQVCLATSLGIRFLPDIKTQGYEQLGFQKFGPLDTEVWDLCPIQANGEEILLVAKNDGVIQLNKHGIVKPVLTSYAPWKIVQSKFNPSRVYIGLDNGLVSILRKNHSWVLEKRNKNISSSIFNIYEDIKGNIWCGTFDQGLLRIDNFDETGSLSNYEVFNSEHGLPDDGPFVVESFQDEMVIGTNKGIYRYDTIKKSFELHPAFPLIINNGKRSIYYVKADGHKLWLITFDAEEHIEVGYVENRKGGYVWEPIPFKTISEGIIHNIFIDEDKVTWLGGTEGLYRYDSSIAKNYEKDFTSLIRMNIIGEDSTMFFGSYFDENGFISTIQPNILKPTLKYTHNSLWFKFAAQNTEVEHPVLYSFYLEGFDKKWSGWSENSERYYTNLREGKYTFKVKAKNIYNHQSKEASYEFQIKPPWYRTILAYIGFSLTIIGVFWVIVVMYTRNLRAIIRRKTQEIREQKEIVEEKNKEITDSIKYAKRIQHAMLPPNEILQEAEVEHFILFKPRDIVSGDFYWYKKMGDYVVMIAADCTGHGVPGAFVSMLGMAFLNEISASIAEVKADEMLNLLRAQIIKSLRQKGQEGESKDGMDISLCILDQKNRKLQFAGAYNPLYIVRGEELITVKADRMPIGYYVKTDNFTNNQVDLEVNDMLYTFSDGYQDQFGGETGGKFKTKNFKKLLIEISRKTMEDQKQILDDTMENWKGTEHEQIDDIIVFGVRIK